MEPGVAVAWGLYLLLLALLLGLAAKQDGHLSAEHLGMVGGLAVLGIAGAWRASLASLSPWLAPLAGSAVVLLVLVWSRGRPATFYRRRVEAMEQREADDDSAL